MSADQDSERVRPGRETTIRPRMVKHVPTDTIRETLERESLVEDVEEFESSDFVYGLEIEVTIPENTSFNIHGTIRDLGLYIEYVQNYGDVEVLHLRRVARLLERMGQSRKYDRYPEYDDGGGR